jgi:hypothetical protein
VEGTMPAPTEASGASGGARDHRRTP